MYLSASNVGDAPASMSTTSSVLIDGAGRRYNAGGPYAGNVGGQGLDEPQQPGTTRTGWIAFDVPRTVTTAAKLIVQADTYMATTNRTTTVRLS